MSLKKCDKYWRISSIGATFIAVLAILSAPPVTAQQVKKQVVRPPKYIGMVSSVNGNAMLLEKGKRYPLIPSMALLEGQGVKTGPDGRVQIVFYDDSVMHIGSNTQLIISRMLINKNKGYRRSLFKMYFGRVRAVVTSFFHKKSTFDIHTPTAVAGVRGSEAILDSPRKGKTTIIGVEGKILGKIRATRQVMRVRPNTMVKVSSDGRSVTVATAPPNLIKKARQITSLDGEDIEGSIQDDPDAAGSEEIKPKGRSKGKDEGEKKSEDEKEEPGDDGLEDDGTMDSEEEFAEDLYEEVMDSVEQGDLAAAVQQQVETQYGEDSFSPVRPR